MKTQSHNHSQRLQAKSNDASARATRTRTATVVLLGLGLLALIFIAPLSTRSSAAKLSTGSMHRLTARLRSNPAIIFFRPRRKLRSSRNRFLVQPTALPAVAASIM